VLVKEDRRVDVLSQWTPPATSAPSPGYPGPMEPKPRAPSPALAFALSHRICSRCLSAQLTTRPFYTRFARSLETLFHTISSIPSLYTRADLSQLSFYLGRAGATPGHLVDRWKAHAHESERGHDVGLVLFRASTPRILAWERLANRALLHLADHARLRVANLAPDGRGPAPSTPHSCLYLTWELCPPRPLVAARSADAPALALAVGPELAPSAAHTALTALSHRGAPLPVDRAAPCAH
jgi:hypothetical protein